MKRTALITIFIITLVGPAYSTEFWGIYAEKFTYNYTIKAGVIPMEGISQRLDSDEVLSLATKSFSQSFGTRFSEVAKSRRALLFVCIFSREPEKCYLDAVLDSTFSEIHFIDAPRFSQKFVKRVSKFYTRTLSEPDSMRGMAARAKGVPRMHAFNPRFGVSLDNFEVIFAAPFYTYYGIYVEPRYGTDNGANLTLMRGRLAVDFNREGVSFSYRLKGLPRGFRDLKITVRPEGEFYIDNVIIFW